MRATRWRALALGALLASTRAGAVEGKKDQPARAGEGADSGAHALDAAPDGTIVRIEKDTAFFDVGAGRAHGQAGTLEGLKPGTVLRVLSTVSVKHPVTGEELVDHFPLGSLTVVQVGRVLSFGRIDRRIAAAIKVGDVVRLPVVDAPPPVAASVPGAGQPRPPGSPSSVRAPAGKTSQDLEDAVELSELWGQTLGLPPGDRARLLDNFVSTHPGSPWSEGLRREILTFRALDRSLRDALHASATAALAEHRAAEKPRLDVRGALPPSIYRDDPLEIAVAIVNPVEVEAVFAFVRPPEKLTYERLAMTGGGDGTWRVTVPPSLIVPPRCDVFVEVVERSGVRSTGFGNAEAPAPVVVLETPSPQLGPSGPGHSAVRGFFEYVDFNRFRQNDYYLLAESDFKYRLGGVLWAVSTGFGVLSGQGGNVAELDANDSKKLPTCPDAQKAATDTTCGHEVGFNYGYVEGELHFGEFVGMSGRLIAGHTVGGHGIGAELKLRIGRENGTNLVIGANALSDIGALAMLALEWDAIAGFPMSASVVVTNQPAEQDIGVRLVYQIAYRARSWFQPALRVGYDARNITHAGVSLGLGLVMGW